MLSPEILEYYERGGEHVRLDAGNGRLEFLRTLDILRRALPPAPARILDVGGATGVYAGPLAEAGYDVRVVDPVPGHVTASAALPGVTAVLGDARDLPADDDSADAVLLLGPLYHLFEHTDRITAWREAARVARPGGLVAGATISRFAPLFDGVTHGFVAEPGFPELVDRVLADGMHNPGGHTRWFTSAYMHQADEPGREATEAGLSDIRTVAIEGPMWLTGERLHTVLADERHAGIVLDQIRRIEHEPSLLGASSHLMTLGVA